MSDIVDGLQDARVAFVGDLAPPGDWQGKSLCLYLPGRSVRTTDVFHAGGQLDVVIRTPATADDHLLAARVADWCSRGVGSAIDVEFFGTFPADEFRDRFGQEWAESGEEFGFGTYMRIATEAGSTLETPGPYGSFFLGPRLLAELHAMRDDLAPWQRLKRRMLEFYYPAVRHGSRFRYEKADGTRTILAFWYAHETMLLTRADQVVLAREDGEPTFLFPWDELSALAEGHVQFVDEVQPLIQAYAADEWPALLDRARVVGHPFGSANSSPEATQES